MPVKIAIINDEISDDIGQVIDFIKEVGVGQLDLRSINGINLLDIPKEELEEIAAKLQAHSIRVGMIVSPLFKWYSTSTNRKNSFVTNFDLHHFNPHLSEAQKKKYIETAINAAVTLNANKLRIFSQIRISDVVEDFFSQEEFLYRYLLKLATKHKIDVYLENEPMCNLAKCRDIENFFGESTEYEGLKLLPDIGSLYFAQDVTDVSYLKNLINKNNYLHLKDYDQKHKKYVTLGEGSIPYLDVFSERDKEESLTLVLETHTQQDLGSMRKSLLFIERMCLSLGLTLLKN